jgi:hypothetical protein
MTNEGRAKSIIEGYEKNPPTIRLQDRFEEALDEAEARGRAVGLEEAISKITALRPHILSDERALGFDDCLHIIAQVSPPRPEPERKG